MKGSGRHGNFEIGDMHEKVGRPYFDTGSGVENKSDIKAVVFDIGGVIIDSPVKNLAVFAKSNRVDPKALGLLLSESSEKVKLIVFKSY